MPGELAPRRTLVKIDMCSDLVGMSVSSRLVGMVVCRDGRVSGWPCRDGRIRTGGLLLPKQAR